MQVIQLENPKITYLNGLRGVAAFVVLIAHSVIAIFPAVITFSVSEAHYPNDTAVGLLPIGFMWNGNFAVCVFFVLSGYVLADFSSKTTLSFAAQVVRRYFRLVLPIFITSSFAYLLLKLSLYRNYDAAVAVTKSGWLSMWYNFEPNFTVMLKESAYEIFSRGNSVYNSNLWTMYWELFGSILIFLLFALFRSLVLRNIVAVIFIFWWGGPAKAHYYTMFAYGVLIYLNITGIQQWMNAHVRSKLAREVFFVILFCFGLFLGSRPELPNGMSATWHSWLSDSTNAVRWHMWGAIIVLLTTLMSNSIQAIFDSKVAQFLGKISFVLYLIHLPLICSFGAGMMLVTQSFPYPYWLTGFLVIMLNIAVSLLFSSLLYKFVDQHTTTFSRYIGRQCDRWFIS